MKKIFIFILLFALVGIQLNGKEGMWIPILLEKYNISEMQEMGFKLTARDIYDVNNASMKDAIVIFGGGCTGELISNEGLLITNHHCGYRNIQSHSTVENDYLTNGFWAMNKSEELTNPGLTVKFLEYMKDVTEDVLKETADIEGTEKDDKIQKNISRLEKEASDEGKFSAQIKPLFYGNQYFLYVYKTYTDIRLVGAPPSAIGKFGGDTDNWMWPRHTGDFSLFRIYAGKDNEPAEYSPDNVPYKPKKYFPISLKGIQPDDFTMVFGYPGSTMKYIPSQQVDVIMNQRNPNRIEIRDKKLEIIGADMQEDPKIRIQYAAKYARISNSWKKWQGEIKGLERLDAVKKKKKFENEFKNWALQNNRWENEYKQVFENFEYWHDEYVQYINASDYYSEIVLRGIEIFELASRMNTIINNIENKQSERVKSQCRETADYLESFFKDFNQPTDERLFTTLLQVLNDNLDTKFLPLAFTEELNKYDENKLLKKVYLKSALTNKNELTKLLEAADEKQLLKLRKDPLISMYKSLNFYYETHIQPRVKSLDSELDANMKKYMAGIMEMEKGNALYPDANLTLRVAYGKVEGYEPMDGVAYKYYTTLTGIMEKDNPAIYDYDVPERLKALYNSKDFGRYEVNGDVPVCFTASNHTSGGNSGSPVINASGELIGVNFDRCWEGTMSDIMFDPERCRNISLDMRYALFLIDKFAGAGYLLDEMKIVE